MPRHLQLFLTLAAIGGTCAGPAKFPVPTENNGTTTENNYGVHPVFGPLTPSQEIKDFVASVFRQIDSNEAGFTAGEITIETTLDSAEEMRPTDESKHAHMGYEAYWPNNEWVQRKAQIERCNTTAECHPLIKNYGPVCAGSHNLKEYHTFDNMCEMEDTNCRDGTGSIISTSRNVEDIKFWPVRRNGYLDLKILATTEFYVVLQENKNIYEERKFFFVYGKWGHTIALYWTQRVADLPDSMPINWERVRFAPADDVPFLTRNVRNFRLAWNELNGQATWTLKDRNWFGYYDEFYSYPTWAEESSRNYLRFPVRYIGIYGSWVGMPLWIEMTGHPRGYLTAYRGQCRQPLPTLATMSPDDVAERHKVQVFNFGERMDEFGYTFSRVPAGKTAYVQDDYANYPGLP